MSRPKLLVAGFSLHVRSIAGLETCVTFPADGLNIVFDLGCVTKPSVNQSTAFISHGHLDHAGAVHLHAAQRGLQGMSPPTYYVHPSLLTPLHSMLDACKVMDGTDIACTIQAMTEGDKVILKGKSGSVFVPAGTANEEFATRPHKYVTCWPTEHRVPSQGYIVWQRLYQLKAEFKSLAGADIAALRKSSPFFDIHDQVDEPLVAFTGDSTIEGILACEAALRARVLVLEVTGVDDALCADKCRGMGHVHLDHVAANHRAFDAVQALVFIHFSQRYSAGIIMDRLKAVLPPTLLERVYAAVDDCDG